MSPARSVKPRIDPLVEVLDDRLLSTAAAAQYLDVHPVTLRKWRRCKAGPRHVVTEGGNIRYELGELRRWARARA